MRCGSAGAPKTASFYNLWLFCKKLTSKIFFVKFPYKSITSTNSFTPAGFLILIENGYHLFCLKSITYKLGPRVARVVTPFYYFLKFFKKSVSVWIKLEISLATLATQGANEYICKNGTLSL